MNASSDSVRPTKRHGILFKLGIALGILVLLLIILYFVVTSSAFFTGVILPKASKAANADITVSSASIHPWSEVELRNLKVVPHGKEQLLTAELVRARYSLRDIIGGRIVVSEATVSSPVITYVKNADGTSNVDPMTEKKADEPEKPKEKSAPPQLDIRNVTLKNALITVTMTTNDVKQVAQISNFDLAIDQIRNGQPGKLTYAGQVSIDQTGLGKTNSNATGSLASKLNGEFAFLTTANLEPQSITGSSKVDVTSAKGSMSNLSNLAVLLDSDLTPTEVRKLNLQLAQSGRVLGELRVSGPFVLANQEGRLKVELSKIDKNALGVVGKQLGYDFNNTAMDSSNLIELRDKGNIISINGQFNANNLSVTQTDKNLTTPVLSIQMGYQVDVDQNKKSALISKLNITGTQNDRRFLETSLSKPMPVSWGGSSSVPDEASLDVVLTKFNLADWKAFAAEMAPAGVLDSTLRVVSKEGGKKLSVELVAKLNDFSATFGSNQISKAGIDLTTKAQIEDFKNVTLDNYHFQLARENAPAVVLDGSGTVNTETKDMDVKTTLEAQVPQLLGIVKVPDMNASAGSVQFQGRVVQNQNAQTLVGNLVLNGLSGKFAEYILDRFQTKVDIDVAVKNDNLQVNKANGNLQMAGFPGGSFEVNGTRNMTNGAGQFKLKLTDLNQNVLKAFANPALGGKQLVRGSINADVNAKMEASGKATIAGAFGFTNLVVKAPDQAAPAPLAAQFNIDASLLQNEKHVDLRQFQIALTPTPRAKNQIDIQGQVDLPKTNDLKGELVIKAESLDLTAFYDSFAGQKSATNAPVAQQPGTGAPAGTPEAKPAQETAQEPEPMQLPIQNLAVTLNIGALYLHDIAISNWQTGVKIQNSHVVVNPFQLTLNGAPVNSTIDADLGVKGYKYDVAFSMDQVPVAPLVDTFVPEQKGQIKGTLLADMKIKGAGLTPPSWRKSLQGQGSLNLTNTAIHLQTLSDTKVFGVSVGPWLNLLIKPIATYLNLPEVLSDPLNSVGGRVNIAQGTVNVQSFKLQSGAFIGDVHGAIPMADVLTDSRVDLPMSFYLAQHLTKKVPALAALGETNAPYVELPDFVKVGGTLGKPAVKPNLTLKSGLSILKGIGGQVKDEKAKSIITGIGGILGGKGSSAQGTNAAPQTTTNVPPGTNVVTPPAAQPVISNLFNNLFKK